MDTTGHSVNKARLLILSAINHTLFSYGNRNCRTNEITSHNLELTKQPIEEFTEERAWEITQGDERPSAGFGELMASRGRSRRDGEWMLWRREQAERK
ncbi:hypothetical protein TEQG_08694 [Trichophyton equinum CBS 127.97]|uniref:Uncharacterized protein n=1 Tax=Trichophyton equinum (strain ATCC MYA-4606 / CBS 127.97) TaxID=559882 RepID=F2PTS8_TRIEC|nr:hypothetical protein TEQG_08694 [Trichophyton equinum CBS 127.97]